MTRSERNQEKAAALKAQRRGETISVGKFTGIATPLQQGYEQQAAEITARNQAAASAAKDAKAQRAILENKRNITRAQEYLGRDQGPQQGSYYDSQGNYTGPRGGGVQSSRLQGSIKPEGVAELEQRAQQARAGGDSGLYQQYQSKIAQIYQSSNRQERARILAQPTPSGFRQVNGRTQTLTQARVERVTPLSPGFAGKASTIPGLDVRSDNRVLLQEDAQGNLQSTGTPVGARLAPLNFANLDAVTESPLEVNRSSGFAQAPFLFQPSPNALAVFNKSNQQSQSQANFSNISTKFNRVNIPGISSNKNNSPKSNKHSEILDVGVQVKSQGKGFGANYIKPAGEYGTNLPISEKIRRYFNVKYGEGSTQAKLGSAIFGGPVQAFEEFTQPGVDLAVSLPETFKASVQTTQNVLAIYNKKYNQVKPVNKIPTPLSFRETDESNLIQDPVKQGSFVTQALLFGADEAVSYADDIAVTIGKTTKDAAKRVDVLSSLLKTKTGEGLPGTRIPVHFTQKTTAITKGEEQTSYLFGLIKGKPKPTTNAFVLETKGAGGFDEVKGAVKSRTTIQPATPDYSALVDDVASQRSIPASFVGKDKPVKVSQGRLGFIKTPDGNVLIAGGEKTRVANLDFTPQARKNLDRSLLQTTQRDYKIQAVATNKGDDIKIVGETFAEGQKAPVSQNAPYFTQKDIKAIRQPPKGKIDSLDVTLSKTLGEVDEGPAKRIVRYNPKTGEFVDTPNFVGGKTKSIAQIGLKKEIDSAIPEIDTREVTNLLREKPRKQIELLKPVKQPTPKVLKPELPDQPNIIVLNKQTSQSSKADNILGSRGENLSKRIVKDYAGVQTKPVKLKLPVKLIGKGVSAAVKAGAISKLVSNIIGKQKSNLIGKQKPIQDNIPQFDTQKGSKLIDDITQGQRVERITDTSQKQDSFLKITSITAGSSIFVPPTFNQPPNKPVIKIPVIPFGRRSSSGGSKSYGRYRNPFAGTRKYKTATPADVLKRFGGGGRQTTRNATNEVTRAVKQTQKGTKAFYRTAGRGKILRAQGKNAQLLKFSTKKRKNKTKRGR